MRRLPAFENRHGSTGDCACLLSAFTAQNWGGGRMDIDGALATLMREIFIWNGIGQTDVRPSEATCGLLRYYLQQLPESVSAISCGNMGVSVFWLEKEGVQTLDLLIDMITKLQQVDRPLTD